MQTFTIHGKEKYFLTVIVRQNKIRGISYLVAKIVFFLGGKGKGKRRGRGEKER